MSFKMKVLFTGANGFLGKNVIPKLRSDNFEVKTLGKQQGDYVFDLTNEIPLFKEKFDIIFHAAGKAHAIPVTTEEEEEFYRVNFEGTKRLCKALEKELPRIFIFISSVAVYGNDSGEEITEASFLGGKTPYSKSKILAEEFLLQWCGKNDVKLFIFRPPLIAGPYPPGNLGDMINAIKQGRYFNIAGNNSKKSIFWVEDFAKILSNTLDKSGGIYNVSDNISYSFRDISWMICESIGKRRPFEVPFLLVKALAIVGDIIGPRFPINSLKLVKMTNTLTFSNKKMISELGFIPSNVKKKFQI